MLNFDPTRIEAKREGRVILANIAGIPLEDAAMFFTEATHHNFRSSFNAFTAHYRDAAKLISDYRPEGIGPGEMIAWFLFDNITLGGKNAPVDLLIDGEPFVEMKGGQYSKSHHALEGFKITKDNDLAVDTAIDLLTAFNDMHRQIVGDDLPGWRHAGDVRTSSWELWSAIDLDSLRKRLGQRESLQIVIQPDGSVTHGITIIGNISDLDIGQKLEQFQHRPRSELFPGCTRDIQVCWANQAIVDYVGTKTFALMDARTFQILSFGPISPDRISLHRMHRNQPWARIKLPN